jgi:glycosyltransferase involved in cell wall biosynthesis
MKVLLLPTNTASDISHKVRALRQLGIDAHGLTIDNTLFHATADIEALPPITGNSFTYRLRRMAFYSQVWRWICWADIVHWLSDAQFLSSPSNRLFLRLMNKPGVVQWGGSEIRIPEVDFAINPYYRKIFNEGYEYQNESYERSNFNQRFFSALRFYPLEFIGMGHYIDSELFPKRFRVWQSIVLSEHRPCYPDLTVQKPLLVHSPSAPVAKGTEYVVRAVEKLKAKYDFDFTLVHGIPRQDVLKVMSHCDIYVDQLIIGGHGVAAIEAMAFGKPVVCYINPQIGKDYPADLPVVNANPDNIAEKLEVLIRDAAVRHELGKKGRQYVEKYHDDQKIARELVQIYEEVICLHKNRQRDKQK